MLEIVWVLEKVYKFGKKEVRELAYWGLEKKISIAYTYDEKDFRRIEDLTVKKP